MFLNVESINIGLKMKTSVFGLSCHYRLLCLGPVLSCSVQRFHPEFTVMRRDGKNTYSQQCRLFESVSWRCLDPAVLHIVTARCEGMPCPIPFLSILQRVDCILSCSSKRLVFIGLDLMAECGATKSVTAMLTEVLVWVTHLSLELLRLDCT